MMGNLSKRTGTAGEVDFAYDMDGMPAVFLQDSGSGTWRELAVYDPSGWRVATYSYESGSNRLKSVAAGMGGTADSRDMSNSVNFVYDQEGNLVEDKSKHMAVEYDWRGMPLVFARQNFCYDIHETIACDSTKLVLAYDASGRRISKTRINNSGNGVWDTTLVTHYTGIGSEVRENLVNNETEVVVNMPQGLGRYNLEDAAVPPSPFVSRTFEWYIKNHLGSNMLVYATGRGTSGSMLAAYDYRAFGEQVSLVEPADKVTENFTGKERDDETGLSYHEARYLDPMLGVWISVDPKRFFSSPYLYMGNGYNPIRFADLNGKAPGDGFDNPDYAAMDAGAAYQLESSFLDKEMGGIIYMLDGAYYATPWTYTDEDVYNASQSEFVDIDAFAKRMVPAGAVEVAEYHGHGRYKRDPIKGDFAWNYNFSWGENSDESSAKLSGRPLYLIPAKMNLPNGMGKPARVYNPITGEDRALKYVDSFNTRKEVNAHKIINNSH